MAQNTKVSVDTEVTETKQEFRHILIETNRDKMLKLGSPAGAKTKWQSSRRRLSRPKFSRLLPKITGITDDC